MEEKDLGIKFDNQLNFKQNTSKIPVKLTKECVLYGAALNSCTIIHSCCCTIQLYNSLLKYGNIVSHLRLKEDIQQLEKVEKH